MATKIIAGEEQFIYYYHEIAVIIVATIALWLLRQPTLTFLDATVFERRHAGGRPGRMTGETMTARKIKAIEKTQKSSEPPSPTHAFERRPSRDLSQGVFDASMVPHLVGNLAVQQLFRAGSIQAKLAI